MSNVTAVYIQRLLLHKPLSNVRETVRCGKVTTMHCQINLRRDGGGECKHILWIVGLLEGLQPLIVRAVIT